MKTDINKLKYYELLDFCIKHEDIEKKEKNEIIEKLEGRYGFNIERKLYESKKL